MKIKAKDLKPGMVIFGEFHPILSVTKKHDGRVIVCLENGFTYKSYPSKNHTVSVDKVSTYAK